MVFVTDRPTAEYPAAPGVSGQGDLKRMTGLVQPFISTVCGSLDGKGRVCIPAPYRHILSAQGGAAGLYACPGVLDPALDVFGQTLLDGINARLAGQDPFFSAGFDDEATVLIARTQQLPIDENGRVRLPDAMIAHAGLTDKIVFVGKAQKFQIWDATAYAPIEADALARVKARMERARSGGVS